MFQTLQQSSSNIIEEEIKQTLDIISKKENGSKALEILNIISYFAPKNIHTRMFLSLVDNEEELGAAIKLLKQCSIVDSDREETTLNVNGLVQRVIRTNLEKQKKEEEILKKVLGLLFEDGINSSNLDHAISTWGYVSEYRVELVQQFSDLPNTIVGILDNTGRHKESYVFAKRQWGLLQSFLGVDHINTLKMRNNMALMLSNCGKYQEALDIFQEVYKKLKNMQKIDYEYILIVQHNIAFALANLGKDEAALVTYKEVFEKRKEILGVNHPHTLLTQSNMAIVLSRREGKHGDALDALSGVYNKQKEILGSDDLATLTTQHNMGTVLLEQGRYQESLDILDEVFNKRKRMLGPDHFTTVMTWSQVAQVLCRQNKYDEGIKILQEALERFNKSLGTEHPETLKMSSEIAAVLLIQGKDQEGLDICNQVYNKQKELLGSGHPNTLATKNIMDIAKLRDATRNPSGIVDNLISLWKGVSINEVLVRKFSWLPSKIIEKLKDDLKYEEAISFGKQATGLLKKVIGSKHVDTLFAQSKIAMVLDANGRYQEAFDIYQEVYQKSKEVLCHDHQNILALQNNMALTLLELGKYQKALDIFNEVLKKQKETLGQDDNSTLTTQSNIARVFDKQGKYEKAANIYKKVYSKQKKILGVDNLGTLTTQHNMAAVLSRQGKHQEALNIFEDVFTKRKKGLGKDHSETLTTQNNIGRVLLEQGSNQEALNVLQEVYHKRAKMLGVNNLYTLITQNLIAQALFMQGKYQESFNIYQEIYPRQKEVLGLCHPEVLATKSNMDMVETLLETKIIQNKNPLSLHSVAKEGDLNKVRSFVQNGANINNKDDNERTPLHCAAQYGHISVVKLLLEKGAIYNVENKEGKTPFDLSENQNVTNLLKLVEELFKDAKGGNLEVISKLKAAKPDEFTAITNARNRQDKSLIQVAIINKHRELAGNLLEMLKNPEQVQSWSDSKYGLDQLKKLKSAAEVHIRFSELYLPMLQSMSQSHGSEKNTFPWKSLKEGSYYLGNAYGLVKTYKECIPGIIDDKNMRIIDATLVALEFDPKHITSGYTDEAYGGKAMCFVSQGQDTVYYKLLHSESKKDIRLFMEMVERNIDTPVKRFLESIKQKLQSVSFFEKLLKAIKNNDRSEVESCAKEGAIINSKNADGWTPLHYAVNNGRTDIVNILLTNGADVTQVTNKGNTPLHIAVLKDHKEIVGVLLQHISSDKLNDFINSRTTVNGTTSLHVAAKNGSLEVIKSLLKHGVIYNIENKEGKTPFDLSKDKSVANLLKLVDELFEDVKNGSLEIIDKLKIAKPDEFVAVTNARNNQGNTLLQVAIANEHENVASKLLEMLKKPDRNLQGVNIESGVKSLKL